MKDVKQKKELQPEPVLTEIGLSDKESVIYEILLKSGKIPASPIIRESQLKRATVYSVLDELHKKGLIEKDDSQPITVFRAKHPYSLKGLVQTKVHELQKADEKLDIELSSLIAKYQEGQVRPGVRFFEGKDGMREVLQDTLTSGTEILSIVDTEAVNKHAHDINESYIAKRVQKKLKKRILLLDTPFAREKYKKNREQTEAAFVPLDIATFNTSLHIYDNKVAYITITEEYITSMIMNDAHIYNMHRSLFEYLWKQCYAASGRGSDSASAVSTARSNT